MTAAQTRQRRAQTGSRGLRRSLHFVPGGNERMFARALELPADSLILDLEDSVAPAKKESARQCVTEWLQSADFGHREALVRINPQDSAWGRDDLEAIVMARPDGLLLPKVSTRAGVDAVDQIVTSLEAQHGLEENRLSLLLLASESPEAVFNLPGLAHNPRVDALTWGVEDLSAALGAHRQRDEDGNYLEVFAYVRAVCLLAAAAAEVQAIDAVYANFSDSKGLQRDCRRAADMGYTGKLTIHPDQIEIVNTAFTPSEEAIAEAEALLAAYEEQQEGEGRLAFSFQGRMVDAPHLKRARDLLAVAAQISGQTG